MEQETKRKRNWWLLPLEIILCILPLILGFYIESSGYGVYPWHSDQDSYSDVFLYYKMIVFIGIAGITFLGVIWKLVKMDKQARKKSFFLFLPMLLYAIFVILSTITSNNLEYSLKGSIGQHASSAFPGSLARKYSERLSLISLVSSLFFIL